MLKSRGDSAIIKIIFETQTAPLHCNATVGCQENFRCYIGKYTMQVVLLSHNHILAANGRTDEWAVGWKSLSKEA